MMTASDILDFLDDLIASCLTDSPPSTSPEVTEAVLRNLDLVREAALTSIDLRDGPLPAYSGHLFRNGCGSISYCAKQRYLAGDEPLSDEELLARLRAFWADYLVSERRPRRTPPA